MKHGAKKLILIAIVSGLSVVACQTAPEPAPPEPIDLTAVATNNELAEIREAVSDPTATDAGGNTPLHTAAANRSYKAALLLLSLGGSAEATNTAGRTPLHVAAASNATDVARLLLLGGAADIEATDAEGNTPLALAVAASARETAAMLAEKGAALIAPNDGGQTPVGRADSDMLDAIVTPSTVNRKTASGNTPLIEAAKLALPGEVAQLVVRGAEINHSSVDGKRPLEIALDQEAEAVTGSLDAARVAAILITAGAQPQSALFSYLVDPLRSRNVNVRTVTNETAIMVAVERGHGGFIDYLIDAGAQLDLTGPDQSTALHRAVRNGNAGVTAKLLNAGASPNVRDGQNRTPLHLAPADQAQTFASLFTSPLLAQSINLSIQDRDGNAVLTAAVSKSWPLNAVRTIVEAGAEVSATNNAGDTPLHVAVRTGQLDVAEYLMENGASAFARNTAGKTPFHLALEREAENASEQALELFLTERGLTQSDENGNTALHIAVDAGAGEETISRILEAGAEVDVRNNRGNTPLHLAMQKQARDLIILFLNKGADLFLPNASGRSPLGVAARLDPIFFKWLVNRGVIGRTDSRGNGPLHVMAAEGLVDAAIVLLNRGAPVDRENDLRETPLHVAAAANNADVVELLLEYGANPNARNQLGDAPLHLAAAAEASDAFSVLLQGGASINVRNANGRTPLFQAVIANRPDSVELLLSQGASPNVQDNQGRTPLHIAAEAGNAEIVSILLAGRVELQARDNTGNTALHNAVRGRHLESTSLLLDAGANVFARNRSGESPLTIALAVGSSTLRRVLSNGRVSDVDDSGNTPLHIAIANGYGVDTAELLIDLGAEPNARNQDGRTPLHLAVSRDASEVGQYLIAVGADIHIRDTAGQSPAILALRAGSSTVNWFFVELVVNAADSQGNTPLHLAAAEGLSAAVAPLLEAGAAKYIRNLAGQRPIDVALQNGNVRVAEQLESD